MSADQKAVAPGVELRQLPTGAGEVEFERAAELDAAVGHRVSGVEAFESVRRHYDGWVCTPALLECIARDERTRLTLILVRCGCGRFLAPADTVAHFTAIIEREGSDYVRDLSLPVGAEIRGDDPVPARCASRAAAARKVSS